MPLPSAKPVLEYPPYVSAKTLNLPGIAHGFFGREGGVSQGVYASLNAGLTTGDDETLVRENQRRIARALGVPDDALFSMKQVHGPECALIGPQDETSDTYADADAIATARKNIAIGILTGDCAPVLFAAPGIIGAAHAGWGGALKGVIERTIEKMESLGARRKDIRAAVGPCIAAANYDVSQGFEAPFMAEDPKAGAFFRPSDTPGKLKFDLSGYCIFRLKRAGITSPEQLEYDTFALEQNYFSHRRTTSRGGNKRGLQMSAIAMV